MSQTYISAELRRLVRGRTKERCEYCLVPEIASFALHEIDHVIAEKHGGKTEETNLALSCNLCNRRKGSDLTSIDPENGRIIPLFNPRQDSWVDHFRVIDGQIVALTSTGRVTAKLLQFNHPELVQVRILLFDAGMMDPN